MWLLCQIPPQPLALCTRLYLPLLQMDAPSELTPQVWSYSPERRTLKKVVFAGPSGTSTQKFGVRTVWSTDEDVRRLLAPRRLHSTEYEDFAPLLILPTSSVRSKRLSV